MIFIAWSIIKILSEKGSLGVAADYKIFDILKIFFY